MFQLVYASSAVDLFSAADLAALLKKSRDNNTRLGVSGMLVYHDGNFMQVLEGDHGTVTALAARIERDPRHRGFLRLMGRDIPEREFGEWSMGFVDSSAVSSEDRAAFSPMLRDPAAAAEFFATPGRAHVLLSTFRRNMR